SAGLRAAQDLHEVPDRLRRSQPLRPGGDAEPGLRLPCLREAGAVAPARSFVLLRALRHRASGARMNERIAVIGLGYVGLPVAIALAKKFPETVGFDVNPDRIRALREGVDATGEVEA